MIGSSRPVAGADTRTCRSSPRPDAGSTIGLADTTGVASPSESVEVVVPRDLASS